MEFAGDVLAQLEAREALARSQFTRFDANKDGKLDRNELHELLKEMIPGCSQDVVEKEFEKADLNHDGEVVWEEFVEYFNNLVGHGAADEKPPQVGPARGGGGGESKSSKK